MQDTSKSGYVLALRIVPFATYVQDCHLDGTERINGLCKVVTNVLKDVAESSLGDHYERQLVRRQQFLMTKKKNVIVLGRYTGNELTELIGIRDTLIKHRYEAQLIKDIPDIPASSSQEKVRTWCQVSRFCVMVDRSPAGHIAEFVLLKQNECILAVLHPENSGSSWLMHDDPVNVNYVKFFPFKIAPLEVLDAAIAWAEGIALERERHYDALYPWRTRTPGDR